jgi:hypothetical protein
MKLSSQEQHFFHAFSELLKKHADMNGKFSLWRVHQHHTLQKDEILHETSDPNHRTSTVRVIQKTCLPDTAFPAQWLVKANGSIETTIWCCE